MQTCRRSVACAAAAAAAVVLMLAAAVDVASAQGSLPGMPPSLVGVWTTLDSRVRLVWSCDGQKMDTSTQQRFCWTGLQFAAPTVKCHRPLRSCCRGLGPSPTCHNATPPTASIAHNHAPQDFDSLPRDFLNQHGITWENIRKGGDMARTRGGAWQESPTAKGYYMTYGCRTGTPGYYTVSRGLRCCRVMYCGGVSGAELGRVNTVWLRRITAVQCSVRSSSALHTNTQLDRHAHSHPTIDHSPGNPRGARRLRLNRVGHALQDAHG